jgi:ABC-2 type transport system permease protein
MLPLGIVGLIVLALSFIMMLVGTYAGVLELGIMTETPELVFIVAALFTWLVLLFLGIAVVMSVFYFSSDIPGLIPLPIPAREVIGAKFVVLLLYSYVFCALGFLPALFVYSARLGPSAYVILSGLLNFVLLPVIPAAVAVMFVFLLNRLISFSRYRTLLEVLGNSFFLVVLVGFQLVLPRVMTGGNPQQMAQVLLQKGRLFAALGKLAPPAKLIAGSIAGESAPGLRLLGVLLATGAVCVGMVVLGERIFYRSYTIQSQVADVPRRGAGAPGVSRLMELSGLLRLRPGVLALVSREWAILRSNSTFLFQSFSEVVLFPMLLVIFRLSAESPLDALPASFFQSHFWSLCCGAVAVVLCGISSIYPSSVSREGGLFGLSLTLPVRGGTQAAAKLLFGLQFTLSAYFLDLVLLMAIFRMSPWALLYVIPMGLAALVFFGSAGVLVDVHRPLLNWTHPQQAMKSNMNVLIVMGVDFLTIAVMVLVAVGLVVAGLAPWEIGVLIAGIFGILDFFVLRSLVRAADSRYSFGFEI